MRYLTVVMCCCKYASDHIVYYGIPCVHHVYQSGIWYSGGPPSQADRPTPSVRGAGGTQEDLGGAQEDAEHMLAAAVVMVIFGFSRVYTV